MGRNLTRRLEQNPAIPDEVKSQANVRLAGSPMPRADRTAPKRSMRGSWPVGASAIRRASTRMTSTTTTSPAKTQRQEEDVVATPPMSGPSPMAIAAAAATGP